MRPVQRAFTAGELDPSLHERVDLQRYTAGLAECSNFIVLAQGGVVSRPGLRYIGPLFDMERRGRLIPFQFNTEQTYILVFEHMQMMVVKDGGFVVDSGDPPNIYTLETPFTESQLPRLIFTQDADVMTITHIDHDPMLLSRTDHDAWSLEPANFTASVSPPPQPTATAVGDGAGTYTKVYRYVVTAVDTNGVESLPSPLVEITTNSLTVTAGVRIDWSGDPTPSPSPSPTASLPAGVAYYRVYKDPSDGSGVYGWIGDSINLWFTDFNVAPVLSDAPPVDYLPFEENTRKPATVGYYQQRTIYANTLYEPQTVFATQTAIYNSFRSSQPPRDDDALEFTIKSRTVNEIRHIIDLDSLVLLTSGAEWRITEGQDMVLTPSTLGARAFSYYGASWCAPALTGDSAVYVQEKGSRVRDIYRGGSDFSGSDLTIMARHLFSDDTEENSFQIEEMAYAAEPYGVLWCVRDDGVMLAMTYQREHEVWAWHHHHTDGHFESVASIPEDGRDAVYVIVRRVVDGETVRYVERIEKRLVDSPENCFFVDSGLTYEGSPADEIAGLNHLEGKEVAVLADGNEVQGLEVVGGSIVLPEPASVVQVGLPYTPALQTLPLNIQAAESIGTQSKSVNRLNIKIKNSRGGFAAPVEDNGQVNEEKFSEIPPRLESDGYGTIQLKTEMREVVMYDGWTLSGAVRIEQRSPLPMEILSITPETDVD